MNTYEYARMSQEDQQYIEQEIQKSRTFSKKMASFNMKIFSIFALGVIGYIIYLVYNSSQKKNQVHNIQAPVFTPEEANPNVSTNPTYPFSFNRPNYGNFGY